MSLETKEFVGMTCGRALAIACAHGWTIQMEDSCGTFCMIADHTDGRGKKWETIGGDFEVFVLNNLLECLT